MGDYSAILCNFPNTDPIWMQMFRILQGIFQNLEGAMA